MSTPAIDIEDLIAEIRAEAGRLRGEPGSGPSPAPEAAPLLDEEGEVDRLLELADPRDVRLHSHRGRLGAAVIGVKRTLARLLTPILERQAEFNRGLARWLGEADLRSAESAAALERRLEALERTLPNAPGPGGEIVAGLDHEALDAAVRDVPRDPAPERYLDLFAAGPVLDLGCGRGHFLRALAERGLDARGVDCDPLQVSQARGEGLEVVEGSLVTILDGSPDQSLGGIVALRVLEHLGLPEVLSVLALARRKLRPGGVLLLETLNVASLRVHATTWAVHPLHRLPLHPLTLRFLVEQAEFAEVGLWIEPEPGETRLEGVGDEDATARNAARLNALIFGPHEYAVVARA